MELNDNTDYQRCFGCGPRNPYGLQMIFRLENNMIVSDFMPREEHQGFPGVIHGGIIATILDEALNRTSRLSGQPMWTMTGRLEVRYRQNVPYGAMLRVRASLTSQRDRMVQATGMLTLADDESTILAEGKGTFIAPSPETLEKVMKDYPGMQAFFENNS